MRARRFVVTSGIAAVILAGGAMLAPRRAGAAATVVVNTTSYQDIDNSDGQAPDAFKSRADALGSMLKATPRIPGVDEILLPGERAWRTSEAQATAGIALADEVFTDLAALANRLGVDPITAAALHPSA